MKASKAKIIFLNLRLLGLKIIGNIIYTMRAIKTKQ